MSSNDLTVSSAIMLKSSSLWALSRSIAEANPSVASAASSSPSTVSSSDARRAACSSAHAAIVSRASCSAAVSSTVASVASSSFSACASVASAASPRYSATTRAFSPAWVWILMPAPNSAVEGAQPPDQRVGIGLGEPEPLGEVDPRLALAVQRLAELEAAELGQRIGERAGAGAEALDDLVPLDPQLVQRLDRAGRLVGQRREDLLHGRLGDVVEGCADVLAGLGHINQRVDGLPGRLGDLAAELFGLVDHVVSSETAMPMPATGSATLPKFLRIEPSLSPLPAASAMYSPIWPIATPADPATPPSAPRSWVALPTMLASTDLDESAERPRSSMLRRAEPVWMSMGRSPRLSTFVSIEPSCPPAG